MKKREQEELDKWDIEDAIRSLLRYQEIANKKNNKEQIKKAMQEKIKNLQEASKEL